MKKIYSHVFLEAALMAILVYLISYKLISICIKISLKATHFLTGTSLKSILIDNSLTFSLFAVSPARCPNFPHQRKASSGSATLGLEFFNEPTWMFSWKIYKNWMAFIRNLNWMMCFQTSKLDDVSKIGSSNWSCFPISALDDDFHMCKWNDVSQRLDHLN